MVLLLLTLHAPRSLLCGPEHESGPSGHESGMIQGQYQQCEEEVQLCWLLHPDQHAPLEDLHQSHLQQRLAASAAGKEHVACDAYCIM